MVIVPFIVVSICPRSHWPSHRSRLGAPAPPSVTLSVPSFPFRWCCSFLVTLAVPSFPFRRSSPPFGHIGRSPVPFQALQHPIRSHCPFPRSRLGAAAPYSVTLAVPSFPFRRSGV